MILCPSCSHRNPEGAKRCQACGEAMAEFVYRVCPACDAVNAAESAFCHRCLTPLDDSVRLDAGPSDDVPVTPYAPPIDLPKPATRPRPKTAPAKAPAGGGIQPILTTPVLRTPEDVPTNAYIGDSASMPDPLTLARDPLAGLEQLLPADEGALGAQASPLKPARASSDRSREDADLFYQVATEPARLSAGGRVVLPAAAGPLSRWGRGALYLLVLMAALAPWFSGNVTGPLVRPRAGVIALAEDLAALPSGSAVLVAFDYGPGSAGELDPLASAALGQLAARSVRIIALSTHPAGLGQAQRILDGIGDDAPDYRYGTDYIVLGFVPGEEAGLRAVGESLLSAFPADYRGLVPNAAPSLADLPVMQGVATVRDVDRLIVISEDGQALRRWVEQVHSRTGVVIDALVTAAVEPLLAPYRSAGQLGHVLAGATGATELRLASGLPPDLREGSDGYAALALVLAAVALLTNVAELASWARRLVAGRDAAAPSGTPRAHSSSTRTR